MYCAGKASQPSSIWHTIAGTRAWLPYCQRAGSSCLRQHAYCSCLPSRAASASASRPGAGLNPTDCPKLTGSTRAGSTISSKATTWSSGTAAMPWSETMTRSTLPESPASSIPCTSRPICASTARIAARSSGEPGPWAWAAPSGCSKYRVASRGRVPSGSDSHDRTRSTRSPLGRLESNWVQRVGCTPRTGASLPGQNSVAVGIPAFSAVTHSGSPSLHQRPSPTASRSRRVNRPSPGSDMELCTMPWRSGRSPVTRV